MIYMDLEKIYKERNIPNKYILTLVVAARARQLSMRRDAFSSDEKFITRAVNDLTEGRIKYTVVDASPLQSTDEPVETK